MAQFFSIPGLGSFKHTERTRQVLEANKNKSSFIRQTIITFAESYGFMNESDNGYMPDRIKIALSELQQKSHYVDYSYIAAFWWLRSLDKYKFHSKSDLMRAIICDQQDQ